MKRNINGVGGVNLYGDSERELQVIVDPAKLAAYRLTIPELVQRLKAENAAVTGGDVNEGKRRYIVRTDGELNTPEDVRNVLLRSERSQRTGSRRSEFFEEGYGRVTVGDVATVQLDYKERFGRGVLLGEPALGFNLTREQGANVLETMKEVRAVTEELVNGPIKQAGLSLRQVYDETQYINSSISLVTQNIYYGGVLAVIVLLLFLRSWRHNKYFV